MVLQLKVYFVLVYLVLSVLRLTLLHHNIHIYFRPQALQSMVPIEKLLNCWLMRLIAFSSIIFSYNSIVSSLCLLPFIFLNFVFTCLMAFFSAGSKFYLTIVSRYCACLSHVSSRSRASHAPSSLFLWPCQISGMFVRGLNFLISNTNPVDLSVVDL